MSTRKSPRIAESQASDASPGASYENLQNISPTRVPGNESLCQNPDGSEKMEIWIGNESGGDSAAAEAKGLREEDALSNDCKPINVSESGKEVVEEFYKVEDRINADRGSGSKAKAVESLKSAPSLSGGCQQSISGLSGQGERSTLASEKQINSITHDQNNVENQGRNNLMS